MPSPIPVTAFDTARDPFLLVDGSGTIQFLNRAAADLLGCEPHAGLGQPCWRLVGLETVSGEPFCRPVCPIRRLAREGRPSARHRLVRRSEGAAVEIDLFTTLVPSAPGHAVLHLVAPRPVKRAAPSPPAADRGALGRLTLREQEILEAISAGEATDAVAERLCISRATVRNHVRAVLRKLRVHRRLDAIMLWLGRPH